MRELEKILKALANRRRLAILQYLKKNKEANVGGIAREIGLSFKSTSRHLAILAALDIVEREQRSAEAFYRLASSEHAIVRHLLVLL